MTRPALLLPIAAVMLAGCAATPTPPPAPRSAVPAAEVSVVTPPPPAGANPVTGGAEMLPERDLVANLAQSADHVLLTRAITAAGLGPTLATQGPFTIFAPTDAAFARLAPGTLDTLLQPANRGSLVRVLTYHVVPGALTAANLQAQITAGGGRATLRTVEGQPLTATVENNVVVLADANGNRGFVTQADVRQANGMMHVVNGVLVPALN